MSKLQLNFTSNPIALDEMYNVQKRLKKANKIIAVLKDHFGCLGKLKLLDLSCSTGIMANEFAKHFGEVVGVDIDKNAIFYANKHKVSPNVSFIEMNAIDTDFNSKSFDVVICNQMYEHLPKPEALFIEIKRLLKDGGVCYFGATSRLKVIETHYGRVPFLSYLPKRLANIYLKILKKGDCYYENLYTYWGLKKLVGCFTIIDYTIPVLSDPVKYHFSGDKDNTLLANTIMVFVCKLFYKYLPGYIWLLKKK